MDTWGPFPSPAHHRTQRIGPLDFAERQRQTANRFPEKEKKRGKKREKEPRLPPTEIPTPPHSPQGSTRTRRAPPIPSGGREPRRLLPISLLLLGSSSPVLNPSREREFGGLIPIDSARVADGVVLPGLTLCCPRLHLQRKNQRD